MTSRLIGLVVSCALGAAAGAAAAEPQRVFEYLHIEANAGGSSGGHAAVCFEDSCFHFQQQQGGFIRLEKDDAARLDHSYRALGNRTVHAYRAAVSQGEFARLAEAFERYHLIQTRHFEVLQALRTERAFLRGLLNETEPTRSTRTVFTPLRVPGSAYFLPVAPAASGRSTALEDVLRRLRESRGRGFLANRAAALRQEIEALDPVVGLIDARPPERERLDPAFSGSAERYQELLSRLLAVTVLRQRLGLRDDAVWSARRPELELRESELATLRRRRAELIERVVRLFDSRRPDWGYPMLVALARLQAVDASIASRHLVLLDVFREDAETVASEVVARYRSALIEIERERLQELEVAREQLFASRHASELHWSRLEAAGNKFLEMDNTLTRRAPLRVHHEQPTPAKSARRDWPLPHPPAGSIREALVGVEERERNYDEALHRLYRYDMVGRNCVTEIFRTIEMAGGTDGPSAGRRVADADVGGSPLDFIPFVSARTVERELGAEAIERPSYRRLALLDLREREGWLASQLRESSILTSRTYAANHLDPFFLFFTEERRYLRPLLGAVNLVANSVMAAFGVPLLPFDRGTTLRRAVEGWLFSAPEIFFVNLRKGSYPFMSQSRFECVESPAHCEDSERLTAERVVM
jgi:hypothetical protein